MAAGAGQQEHDTASEFGRDRNGLGVSPESHENAEPGAFMLYAFGERLALTAQPRYTTNSMHHYVSLGLAAAAGLGNSYALALEAEPVLLGRDSTTRQLACGLAIQKQVGWHDFAITLGTALNQSAPAMFRSTGPATAYSDILDAAKGWFRIGFNILRKF